jgi:hypothetical protein
MRSGRAFAVALATTLAAGAQVPPRPRFDAFQVATIKPADRNLGGRWIRMPSANRLLARTGV